MTMFRPMELCEFGSMFNNFKKTAFRLEALQKYTVPSEDQWIRDFTSGKDYYLDAEHAEWVSLVRKNTGAGKFMSRVHFITEPLSEYVRFEILWGYRDNVQAGEDVRLLPALDNEWPSSIERRDYWLFDSKLVVAMIYDADGRFLGIEQTTEPKSVNQYLELTDMLLATSIPYRTYAARVR